MAHPYRSEASGTSRSKMRAITGRGGGGTPFLGMSSFKRPGPGGETKSYLGHEKAFAEPSVHGGRVKRRADRFARGGKVKCAEGGRAANTEKNIEERRLGWDKRPIEPYGVQPSSKEARGGKVKKAGGGSTGTGPAHPDIGDRYGPAKRFEEENPATLKFHREGSIGNPMGRQKESTTPEEVDEFHSVAPGYERDYGPVTPGGAPIEDVPQSRRGGRIKRADGGRTMMPYGNEQRRRVSKGAGKKAGNVNIAINMPPHAPHPLGGGMAPPLPPPGGAGGPPGMPPGGGAPPPPIPPALMGGAPPGGMPGAGGAPGGMNPAAMQALAGIAGGAGGPMGAGMPGRGPFARGGGVKSSGLSSNLGHWREYAAKNSKGNTAHNRGATGESEELPLATRRGSAGDDLAVARKRGNRDQRAKGGRIPVPMTGGSETGVGRKQMAKIQPRYR